jgi:hypothetical protein
VAYLGELDSILVSNHPNADPQTGAAHACGHPMQLAAMLGIVTPFCSCSAVPLFIGFVESGIPLGVTFSFLIAAPVINEVALVLLFGLFGWRVAATSNRPAFLTVVSALPSPQAERRRVGFRSSRHRIDLQFFASQLSARAMKYAG